MESQVAGIAGNTWKLPTWMVWAIRGILIAGMVAYCFWPQIVATLTPGNGSRSIGQSERMQLGFGMPVVQIAEDTYQRADQETWGKSTDGQDWRGDAMTSRNFAIVNRMGQIANTHGVFEARLGPKFSDGEITWSGGVSVYQPSNLGIIARWQDTDNWYKAMLDGTHLQLVKRVGGITTTLASQDFQAEGGKEYSLKMRVVGSQLSAKAWALSEQEPGDWQIAAADTQFRSGESGLRLFTQDNVVVTVKTFREKRL